jgi:glycerol-3-phosphate dehydrogenase
MAAPTPSRPVYDAVVVGAGVVGICTARALALLEGPNAPRRIALVEAGPGPLSGASRGNSAFIHTGFDAAPGSAEARFVRDGHSLFESWAGLCDRRGVAVPYAKCGALMLAMDEAQMAAIRAEVQPKAEANGVATTLVAGGPDALAAIEPSLKGTTTAVGGLHVPGEWTVDPFVVPAMWLQEALSTGRVEFYPRHRVESIGVSYGPPWAGCRLDSGRRHSVYCKGPPAPSPPAGPPGESFADARRRQRRHWRQNSRPPFLVLEAPVVVNCAGLHGDAIDALRPWAPQQPRFELFPRLGRFVVFGPDARDAVGHGGCALLPLPTKKTKGVIVFSTHDRTQLVVGPTAEDPGEVDPDQRGVMRRLVASAVQRLPALQEQTSDRPNGASSDDHAEALAKKATVFAGKRPALKGRFDYFLDADAEHRWVTVAGVRSTGLSSSLALGRWVATEVSGFETTPRVAAASFVDPPVVSADMAMRAFGGHVTHPLSSGGIGPAHSKASASKL